ncbi:hypothetical protein Bbelb_319540 [Branchiostoma belcheri]|nr:hypothetical protein Bbelb_319540 [Branchiostoma belcheri]
MFQLYFPLVEEGCIWTPQIGLYRIDDVIITIKTLTTANEELSETQPRGYGHRNIPRLWRVTIAKDSGQASPAWVRHNVAWVPTKKNLGGKKYRDWDESKEQKEGRGPKGRENATSGPRNSRVWRLDRAGLLTPKAARRHTMLLDIAYVIFPTPRDDKPSCEIPVM